MTSNIYNDVVTAVRMSGSLSVVVEDIGLHILWKDEGKGVFNIGLNSTDGNRETEGFLG